MEKSNETLFKAQRNKLIVSAFSKHTNNHPSKSFEDDDMQKDIKSLLTTNLTTDDEMMKWVTFAEEFSVKLDSCVKALSELNDCLTSKSVLLTNGLTPSLADIVVFAAVFSSVKSLEDSVKESLPNLMRWMDYIQNKEDFGESFVPILVQKIKFNPPALKPVEKVEVGSTAKRTSKPVEKVEVGSTAKRTGKDGNSKPVEKVEVSTAAKETTKNGNTAEKADALKSETENIQGSTRVEPKKNKASQKAAEGKAQTEKKNIPEKSLEEKDKEVSVSLLKIQVGLIRKAEKHPSADSLLVEEIDTGDAKPRTVVSGLAKYCNPDELTNRLVVLITNVKPGKLRDVMSEGLVLCASNEDHTVVEPLIAPEGAKVGEIITFLGHDGQPEAVLNPKKKQLDKITPHLFTDDKGVATFKGVHFMTSAGPCTSSIPKASIK